MSSTSKNLVTLARMLAEHENITHWAVSMRIFKKGNYFARLEAGTDPQVSTSERALNWFSENWPSDLEWPRGIPRPAVQTRRRAS